LFVEQNCINKYNSGSTVIALW